MAKYTVTVKIPRETIITDCYTDLDFLNYYQAVVRRFGKDCVTVTTDITAAAMLNNTGILIVCEKCSRPVPPYVSGSTGLVSCPKCLSPMD